MSKRIDGQRLMKAVPDLVQELGAIHDALAAGDVVTIEPGSLKAARIHAVMESIESPSPWAAQIAEGLRRFEADLERDIEGACAGRM